MNILSFLVVVLSIVMMRLHVLSSYLPFLRDKIRVMTHVAAPPDPFLPCPQLLLRVAFSTSYHALHVTLIETDTDI